MTKKSTKISEELQIVRFHNGIKLAKPEDAQVNEALSVGEANRLPFSIYFLNKNGETETINEEGATICGFESVKESIGKSLHDVSEKQSASQLIANCTNVIQSNSIQLFDEDNQRKDHLNLKFLSIKAPWYDDHNNINGILGCSIVLGKHSLAQALSHIRKLGLLDANGQPASSEPKISLNKLKLNNIHLSKREIECLFLTIKGYTAKRIAIHIGISHRTVEEYLNNIRIKAGVLSKAQLIELALANFME